MRLAERQMVRRSYLSRVVAGRFRAEDQDARVPEPVKEQRERYSDDEKTDYQLTVRCYLYNNGTWSLRVIQEKTTRRPLASYLLVSVITVADPIGFLA